ncbi:MAG TPA: hypothetical protein ENJ47_03735 [Candidatus Acetothermia bacterium]|nr:hypothetical protein [Candidatus Acetothermia bacterium]
MRNAMILVGLWIGIILTAYSVVYVNSGVPNPVEISALVRIASRTYTDPDGRFELVLPPGWQEKEEGGALHLTGPLEEVEAWIVPVADMAAVRAIETAWEAADPCLTRSYDSFSEMEPVNPELRRVRIDYSAPDRTLCYGIARVVRGGTVVLLVKGDIDPLQGRTSDGIALIEETLTVRGEF